jgi:hypothetical protein
MSEPPVLDSGLKLLFAQLLRAMALGGLLLTTVVVGLALWVIVGTRTYDGLPVVLVVGGVGYLLAGGAFWGANDYIRKSRGP